MVAAPSVPPEDSDDRIARGHHDRPAPELGEGPADDPRDFGKFKGACVRTQYVEPDFKDPADGKVTMVETDFMDLPKLFKAKAAAATDPGCKTNPPDESCPDPCLGAPMP